jgi:hypothetical protein
MSHPSLDVPRLWTLARASLYPALRSRYATTTLEIDGRTGGRPLPPLMQRPWVADLVLVLLYDFGQHMSYITRQHVESWETTEDELWGYAFHNLKSLPRPRWDPSGDGVFRLISEATYEETFLLLDEARALLRFAGHAVYAIPNRGVLLAADGTDTLALRALIGQAQALLGQSAFPMSGALLQRTREGWGRVSVPASLQAAQHALETQSLSYAYRDQKTALDKLFARERTELFVATFALRDTDDPAQLQSYAVLTEGVDTLLPQADHVIFNRGVGGLHPERLAVPWATLQSQFGQYLEGPVESPVRYRVRHFPTAGEWRALEAALDA